MGRDETVIGGDDLDGGPQTELRLAASHRRVIQHRLIRRFVMSHFVTTGTAGPRAKLTMLLIGGLAAVMGAGAAGAASPDSQVPSIVVHYSEQSLATDNGVNELYHRIVRASKQVCPDDAVRDLASRQMIQTCRQQAVARAIQQIHNSQLAALYASHSKNG